MTVVFDSGIWISAFQFGGIPLRAIEQAFLADEIAYCEQITGEIRKVLVTKFLWLEGEVEDVLSEYFSDAIQVSIDGSLRGVCRDPKDDMIFECAVRSEAGLIVSGDKDLLDVGHYQSIRIVTARDYLNETGVPFFQ